MNPRDGIEGSADTGQNGDNSAVTRPRKQTAACCPHAPRAGADRAHAESASLLWDPFELDVHRIVSCMAFRRLEHKTQVFATDHHDHFRTRLTHTLEVAQIARALARHLAVDASLVEAIALAHDLGHPPFGHAGEAILAALTQGENPFNHNTHALRIVAYLEHPFPAFRGLNLTAAVRAGLLAHETPYDEPGFVSDREQSTGSPTDGVPSVESQIVSVADRIAFNVHDLEDAMGAGIVTSEQLESIELWRRASEALSFDERTSSVHAVRRPILDGVLEALLVDVIQSSRTALCSGDGGGGASAMVPIVRFSPETDALITELECFHVEHVYRHPEIEESDRNSQHTIEALFTEYERAPSQLPDRFRARIPVQGLESVIVDYIAGMTDRFCIREYERLIGSGLRM